MPIEAVTQAVQQAIAETGYQPTDPGGYTTTEPLEEAAAAHAAAAAAGPTDAERIADLQAKVEAAAPAVEAVKALRSDPAEAARALASSVGLRLEEPEQQEARRKAAIAGAYGKMSEALGPEAAGVFAPLVGEVLAELANETFEPIRRALAMAASGADRRQTEEATASAVNNFKESCAASGAEFTPEIEKEMVDMIKSGAVVPGPKATPAGFLGHVYTQVMHQRGVREARDAKRRPDLHREIKAGVNERDAVRAAVAQAMGELGARLPSRRP